ncbi:hypothetical protein [Dactylosporangium sp. CS-033363]|uniref:hypothetical protein n=1 Tax=Dactylosporangium sp. CS-033363 TaxID=3239935 RepID=UPI003D94EE7B
MLTLPCGHLAHPSPSRACPHLVPAPEDTDVVVTRHLTGHGLEYDLVCKACDTSGAVVLAEICEGCADRIHEDGEFEDWRGTPGIAERPEPIDASVRRWPVPYDVVDLAPVDGAGESHWLALTAGGRIAELYPDRDGHRDYHARQVPFAAAFTVHGGRPVFVHRSAWNRLDVSDAETGELLTAREPDRDHRLDYFHGRLTVSGDGRWIADNGWVWSPVGMPRVWDLRRWLAGNVWESENGPSVHRLAQRWYYWHGPLCFVGDRTVALGGIGEDDQWMLAGARMFSAESGLELTRFAGPEGAFFSDGRRLYSAHADGTHVWDPVTGHRTGTVPGFTPTHHHAGAGELAAMVDGQLRRWATGRPRWDRAGSTR